MPIVNPHKLVALEKPRPFVGVVQNHADGDPFDLTGATGAVLKFRKAGTCVVLFEITGSILSPATSGRVSFDWGENLVGLREGRYEGELLINYAGYDTPIYKILQFQLREAF